MTHDDLVARAARWLRSRHKCSVVFAEWAPLTVSEIPDAIGFDRSGGSILVECKRTRKDFLADSSKLRRRGGLGLTRWYFALPGIIMPQDVPEGWGLAELRGDRVYVVVEAPRRAERDCASEIAILSAAVWRHENGIEWRAAESRFAPIVQVPPRERPAEYPAVDLREAGLL